MESVCGRQGKPHPGGIGDFGQLYPVEELELVATADNSKLALRRFLYRGAYPGAVGFLLPGIVGLAVELVDRCFGHGHGPRVAGKKEINIVHIAADVSQVHAGKVTARAQVGQVLGVDSNQLEPEFLVAEGKRKGTSVEGSLVLDVLLDAGLYVCGYNVGHRGNRVRGDLLMRVASHKQYAHRKRPCQRSRPTTSRPSPWVFLPGHRREHHFGCSEVG